MESFSCCVIIDDDRHPRPCHDEHTTDCMNNYSPPTPPSINYYDRRKVMRQRETIKKAITTAALLMMMQILFFGCHASSDNDEAIVYSQLQRRQLQGDNPWLPDQQEHRCTNDKKKDPWIRISKNIQECCKRHFGWDEQTCGQNSADWYAASLNPNQSSSTQLYYPATFEGICKPNSPEKPEWMNVLVSSYEECCAKHVGFDYEKCMAAEPVTVEDTQTNMESYVTAIGPTTPNPTTSPTKSPYSGFYADDFSRKCLPNSSDKPAWNDQVAPTHLECCKEYLSWAYQTCTEDIPPTLRPSPNPTSKPTYKPTDPPTTAEVSLSWTYSLLLFHQKCLLTFSPSSFLPIQPTISSMPTPKPTSVPTTLYRKPTSAPTNPPPTNKPTTAEPTNVPTTSAPTRSPSTILYYADTTKSACLEDTPDRPQWTELISDYAECCQIYLPWVLGECMKKMPKDATTTTSSTISTSSTPLTSSTAAAETSRKPTSPTATMYYADITLSRCVEDSISRPSWITDSALESDYEECCKFHLNWVLDACMKYAPKDELVAMDATVPSMPDCPNLRRTNCKLNNSCLWRRYPLWRCEYKPSSTTTTTTTTVTTTTSSLYKYYVNTPNGKCLIHTADTPAWESIYNNFQECCDASWFDNCQEFIPMAPMSGASSNKDENIVIEVVARGSLNLYFESSPPSPNTTKWMRLIKALRETLTTTFQESDQFHPGMELSLVNLGHTSLLQRFLSSAPQEPAEDGDQHRQLEEFAKLEYEVTLPLVCDTDCQSSSWNLGVETFELMEKHFLEEVNSGVFATALFENGLELGIFSVQTDAPVAGDAKLTYQHAFPSKKTWMPSPGPTALTLEENSSAVEEESEMDETSFAVELEFYPDYLHHVCKSDGKAPAHQDNYFKTLEDCCSFAWLNYATCKKNSVTRSPTSKPSRSPTPNPSNPPSPVPTSQPTSKPTSDSQQQNSAASQPTPLPTPLPTNHPTPLPTSKPQSSKPTSTVYYPDLTAGVCKFDGNHATSPYQFATAQECCDNALFDYCFCMKKTNPYADVEKACKPSPAPTAKPSPAPTAGETLKPTTVPSSMPSTSEPTNKPTTRMPTSRPTIKYTIPPVVKTTIDASHFTTEMFDGFEKGLTTWPWVTTPDMPWSTHSSDKYEGNFSARSHPVKQGEESDLHIAIKSTNGGVINFWMKSDVQMPFSGCYINVDGASKKGYTYPTNEWAAVSLPIPEGQHIVMFRVWSPSLNLPPTGGDAVSHTISIDSVSFMPTISENFEEGKLQWGSDMIFTGNGAWEFDSSYAHKGSTSLRSPVIGAGQSSTLKLEASVPRRGSTLTFWYHAEVWMPVDSFSFKLNGNAMLHITTPESGWKQFTIALPPGIAIIEWTYSRSSNEKLSDHPGEKRVWIDEIQIVPRY